MSIPKVFETYDSCTYFYGNLKVFLSFLLIVPHKKIGRIQVIWPSRKNLKLIDQQNAASKLKGSLILDQLTGGTNQTHTQGERGRTVTKKL